MILIRFVWEWGNGRTTGASICHVRGGSLTICGKPLIGRRSRIAEFHSESRVRPLCRRCAGILKGPSGQ